MDLGQRISTHRGTIMAGGWLWYMGAVLILAGVVGFGKGVLAILTRDGDVSYAFTGVIGFGLGVLALILPILRWRQSVDVYERGLVWTRLTGAVQIAREQVRGARWIQHRGRNGSYDEIEIDLVSGGRRSIVGIDNPEQLRNLLTSWTQPAPQPAPMGWAPPGAQPVQPQQGGWTPGAWKPPGT